MVENDRDDSVVYFEPVLKNKINSNEGLFLEMSEPCPHVFHSHQHISGTSTTTDQF